jgi:hypothetical protein
MKYAEDFVNRVVDTVMRKRCSAREAERLLDVPRKTIGRWLKRRLGKLPYWFSRAAKHVRNRTPDGILNKLRKLLKSGTGAVVSWLALGKRVALRTVQRWKRKWFPPVVIAKKKVKRYQRRKAFSLGHTDWATKRIKHGKKCKFTFYVDDATRKLFGLRAYAKADQLNTFDALRRARKRTRFKAVLTDCGRVYSKQWRVKWKSFHAKAIHTRPYNPQCNGKAEAVVKKVKRFLRGYVVQDIAHANRLLKRFLREYNNTPHGSLKYLTPNQVFRIKRTAGDISAVT